MSEQVICLSDSDDESFGSKERSVIASDRANRDDAEEDFNFPPVDFHYSVSVNKSRSAVNQAKDADCIDEKLGVFVTASHDSTNFESASNNNGAGVGGSMSDDISKKTKIGDEPRKTCETQRGRQNQRARNIWDGDTERTRAKEQATVDRRMRESEKKNRKNMQSGECLKFMRVSIDRKLENFSFHSDVLAVLRNYNISCELESLPIPNSITWIREIENHYVNDSNEICKKTENQRESQIMVVWKCDQAARRIKDQSFGRSVASIALLFPDQRITLIIYGAEEYFERCKKLKKRTSRRNDDPKHINGSDDSPKLSRYDLEVSLAEIQLNVGCNSRLVETAQELAMLVYRFTKAIAEIPLKLERRQKIADKVDWYAMGDNRDTVRVDKNNNGLKRLWQQQLCQFNLASLETAEAVCSVYPSPRELMQAYVTCTPAEGEKLLKDIPIRRAAGPLSTVRKIGPELSKKIFIMFTSKDGEATLGNDRDT